MTTAISHPNGLDLRTDDYIVIGLATCFYKEDGEVHELEIIEPIPSAALEAIIKGIPTSYKLACATTLGSILDGENLLLPSGFPETAQFSEEFLQRTFSATRTYKRRESAQSLIPLGTTKSDFNYSTERKRVLNAARVVTKEDNIKQHSHTHKVL
ncbi:hypothetical protein [Cylindrospermopsis raciborskii]|uniref:Uncharacterized protein n=2 Tax=Cylindrospermopsis raciborskii TaxID=77022 RepID=A0A1X4GA80_9CYAN|nr:hypothetical protein [Cylindrospermopsis raciborskii]MCZ2201015.1 hypothetical protein [Cylindrospermopsis raciborskii PAMP2012]MCZ2206140.1 hypothetical protein [Cylindrospermopsis raciborskii PAMP2011]NLQ06065.1 hypothetical protein [Cylindrospermopsis raciborskii MVCC19]OHY32377.1 hypothetical protein BCV64_12960 [Cylindrospermopsis raciborskii MVCC14]OPH08706.1 hypothetical protein CENA302_14375 [Cylindrospermopsis raciborskii CENA302]